MASVFVLPGVKVEPTPFSLEGSQGWRLDENFALGPDDAFILQSPEFGHLHRPSDGSMHMLLPLAFSIVALEKGWGIIHPLTDSISGENSDYVMIYGPRDEDELKTIWIIAQISYYYARGLSMDPKPSTAITPATWGWAKGASVSALPTEVAHESRGVGRCRRPHHRAPMARSNGTRDSGVTFDIFVMQADASSAVRLTRSNSAQGVLGS